MQNQVYSFNLGKVDAKDKPMRGGLSRYLAESETDSIVHSRQPPRSHMNFKMEENKKNFGNTLLLNPNALR